MPINQPVHVLVHWLTWFWAEVHLWTHSVFFSHTFELIERTPRIVSKLRQPRTLWISLELIFDGGVGVIMGLNVRCNGYDGTLRIIGAHSLHELIVGLRRIPVKLQPYLMRIMIGS